jgi:hypothetical protein
MGSPHHFNHPERTAAESLFPNQQCPEGAWVPRRGAQLRAGHMHLRWAARTPCGRDGSRCVPSRVCRPMRAYG